MLSSLSGKKYSGYEIHMGETLYENMSGEMKQPDGMRTDRADNTDNGAIQNDEVIISSGNVYGSYVHGIFDDSDIAWTLVRTLAEKKGLELDETERGAGGFGSTGT